MYAYTRMFISKLILFAGLGILVFGCTSIHPVKPDPPPAPVGRNFSHELLDEVLGSFVDDKGMVDYRALKQNADNLEAYFGHIAAYSPDKHPERFPSQDHRLAYWINAYNTAVIKTVLTYYPIDSVLDVKTPALFFFLSDKAGFFFFQRLTFGGSRTSLYYLENKVIRKRFKDPRIHFALNCASLSCPRLPRQAFSGEGLDRQLDHETRLFVSEMRNFRIDHREKIIYLSSIFQWYEKDFTNWLRKQYPDREASLINYVRLYLPADKAEALDRVAHQYAVRFIPYDWRLNDQSGAG